jgi:hypothetical protein
MRGCVPAKTILSDDGIAPDLRPFIEVLLNGDCQTRSNGELDRCPQGVDERESKV